MVFKRLNVHYYERKINKILLNQADANGYGLFSTSEIAAITHSKSGWPPDRVE
jgi:hypothetical protein